MSVTLVYEVFPNSGVLRRQAIVENTSTPNVTIENLQAGVIEMPPQADYRLTYSAGRWAGEWQIQQENLAQGKKVLESREGTTSHRYESLVRSGRGCGDRDLRRSLVRRVGLVGQLEGDRRARSRWPHARDRRLQRFRFFVAAQARRESWPRPWLYLGYSDHGFGEMSRTMHKFERANLLQGGDSKLRPVLYNSWEATTFDVTEEGQKTLADKSAKLGVELYVIDDGWFVARATPITPASAIGWSTRRNSLMALKPLIDHVHGLNMKFGFWVEPEMVNPDSDLYRAHPDWAMHFPGRPRSRGAQSTVC